jgi:OmpA-OmpF porin, OOP family
MITLKKATLLATVALVLAPAGLMAADYKNVVRSTNGNVVKNTFGNCVESNFESANNGCAVGIEAKLTKELRNVYFDFNKSTLNAKEKAKLDTVAKLIKESKEVESIDIQGFADSIGKDGYNKALSNRRAAAVKKYLASKGVKTRKIAVAGFGSTKPVTKCESTLARAELIACLAEDRRVEIKLNLKK